MISNKGTWAAGLLSIGMGLFIVLLALGWIPGGADRAQAPRWVIAAAGTVFGLGGAAVLLQAAGAASEGEGAGAVRGLQEALGLALILLLAVIANWVAFGSGERAFSGSVTLFFWTLSTEVAQRIGRIVFGLGAVLMDLILVWAVVNNIRRLRGG